MPRYALLALGLVSLSLGTPSAQTEIATGDYSTPLRALRTAGNIGISIRADAAWDIIDMSPSAKRTSLQTHEPGCWPLRLSGYAHARYLPFPLGWEGASASLLGRSGI